MKRAPFLKTMAWAAATLMYGWRPQEPKPTSEFELWGLFEDPKHGLFWRHSLMRPVMGGFESTADLLDEWKTDPRYVRNEILIFEGLGALRW